MVVPMQVIRKWSDRRRHLILADAPARVNYRHAIHLEEPGYVYDKPATCVIRAGDIYVELAPEEFNRAQHLFSRHRPAPTSKALAFWE
jgi:hypothetical protein